MNDHELHGNSGSRKSKTGSHGHPITKNILAPSIHNSVNRFYRQTI